MFFRKTKVDSEEEIKELKPKKKNPEDEFEWDKKRIILTLFLGIGALLVMLELKKMFLPNTSILGESTVKRVSEIDKPEAKAPNIDLESRVGGTVAEVKENIVNLDPEEIASSSPQIQKVLRDIQGIRDLPANQARNACLKVCSGI